MAMDVSKVGAESSVHEHAYGWRELATYALGIGARRDGELAYLYEGHDGGIRAYPTYGVIPTFEPVRELMGLAGIEMAQVIHSSQQIAVHRPLPPTGKLQTVAKVDGFYDLRRFATARLTTRTELEGELMFETTWSIVVQGEGGFGGKRPPKEESLSIPKDTEPTFERAFATSTEQALLYRLSGDDNPLHADPKIAAEAGFEDGPILHGLCTFGHVGRAVVLELAEGDASRLVGMGGRFSKPVWPGDTIVVRGWDLGDGAVALQAAVSERPDPVMTHMWARLSKA
ncbi:MAG TPA: MaoC family protein [Polyangiaceae bacterium]|nr:MaoC family protein [Polyangiaceae bacterium]